MNPVLLAGAVAAVGVLGLLVMGSAPRLALVAWLTVLCGVPVWAGVTLVVDLEPHVLASAGLVAALLPALLAGRGRVAARVTWADGLFAAFVAAALVGAVAGRSTVSDVFLLVVQWTAAFLAGRLIGHRLPLQWVYGAVGVAATGVAVLALVEFLTGWNPFVLIPGSGSLHEAWAPIQERGGLARAEGAFGHSIALGASLALAAPLTLAARFRAGARLTMVVLQVAGAGVTFSRIGLLTTLGGVALAVLFLRSGLSLRLRWTVVGGLAAVAAAASPLISGVFTAAGAEAADSAGYRLDLLRLVPTLQPFGLADSLYRSPGGDRTFGTFDSIDNALLLVGLDYGWVPLGLVLLLLAATVRCVLSGRATAPTIALAAQIPAFATVALITQYATLLWFVAGLAVFSQPVAGAWAAAGGERPAPPAGAPELSASTIPGRSPGMVNGPGR